MSRTDKDKPYWVRTQWYVPVHNHCQHDRSSFGWYRFPDGPRECNLPADPVYLSPHHPHGWLNRTNWDCHWKPEWPWRLRYPYTWAPRRIDRQLGWYGPDRAQAREACNRAGEEYNTFGQTEVEVPTFQHRHAPKGAGWWD